MSIHEWLSSGGLLIEGTYGNPTAVKVTSDEDVCKRMNNLPSKSFSNSKVKGRVKAGCRASRVN